MSHARSQGGLRVFMVSETIGPLYLPDDVQQWSPGVEGPKGGSGTLWGLHTQGSATDLTQSHRTERRKVTDSTQSLTGFAAEDK